MTAALQRFQRPSGRADLASLEERLGMLVLVRLGVAAAIILGSILAPDQMGLGIGQAGLPCGIYVTLAVAAEVAGRRDRRLALGTHRVMLPLDAVFLVVMTVPAGGPRSQLIVLFSLQLVAATLLGSPRSALRIALWDTFLFVLVPTLGLGPRIGQLLGVSGVVAPSPADTAVAIMGFWAVALCTAAFSTVSERELRRNRNELEALTAMTAELDATTDAAAARRILLAHTTGALGFRRGALIVPGAAGMVTTTSDRRRRGPSLGVADVTVTSPPAAGDGTQPDAAADGGADAIVSRAREAHRAVAVRALDPSSSPVAAGLLPDARNLVVVPVGSGPSSPVLLLEHGGRTAGERVARRTLLIAGQFAAHGSLALETIALLDERERLAAMDGLTGLANRRQFDTILAREVASAERRQEPLSLVLVDVDYFKAVNDSRGHLGGDEVLKGLAGALTDTCRDMDLVARYGGEEFALVLPSCRAEEALGVLRRVDQALRSREQLAGITISSGVATLFEHASDGPGLIAAADDALYESKRAGRDRATVSARRAGEVIDLRRAR